MKKIFFTSNTKHYHKVDDKKIANEIDNSNGFVDQINQLLGNNKDNTILYIAADPNDFAKVDNYSALLFEGFRLSGISFSNYLVLDNRTKDRASDFVRNADIIFLSGGDTFSEMTFFKEINLSELLNDYDGIIIGQSAGSINLAKSVYNSPENGDDSEPVYFDGLGLSDINIEPHFVLETEGFDEMQMYQRKHLIEESNNRDIYGLTDGAHILQIGDNINIYGNTFLIKDGHISQICDEKHEYQVNNDKNISKHF